MKKMKICVVGTGNQGTGIAGLLAQENDVEKLILVDIDKAKAEKAGYDSKKAGIISLCGCLLTTMFLPWSFCAYYSGNVYGVTIGQFIPYAILFPLMPIIVVVLSFLGIGNKKLENTAK